MRQDPGRTVCVQLLQTLNILFENMSNEIAIHYLLSNSLTNEIITHRFDFSDEEVVAYYISFLKTLSLMLDTKTINFFYLESRREFDLYVESIKLFCHPENMVRIAVRTITLNIHRVKDEGALKFIHHQTALPYFSFLVWSIGNTILDIDAALNSDWNSKVRLRMEDLVAEHLDHLHYLNDLLSLNIEGINEVLCDQLLHRLLIPIHVYSLTKRYKPTVERKARARRPQVSHPVAAFMLTHTFLVIEHIDIVRVLAEAIFLGDPSLTDLALAGKALNYDRTDRVKTASFHSVEHASYPGDSEREDASYEVSDFDSALTVADSLVTATKVMRDVRSSSAGCRLHTYMRQTQSSKRFPVFSQPSESLAVSLKEAEGVTPALLRSVWPIHLSPLKLFNEETNQMDLISVDHRTPTLRLANSLGDLTQISGFLRYTSSDSALYRLHQPFSSFSSLPKDVDQLVNESNVFAVGSVPISNVHLPLQSAGKHVESPASTSTTPAFDLQGRPYLRSLYRALQVGPGTDYETLFALLLFSAIRSNPGIDPSTLQIACLSGPNPDRESLYDHLLVGKLLQLIVDACKAGSRIRLVTLHLAIRLLVELVCDTRQKCHLSDEHFAQLVSAREEATMVLRSYFRNDAIFLDLFELEVRQLQQPLVTLTKLALDSNLLVPPLAAGVLSASSSRDDHRRRLPQSELEHAQQSVCVFLLVHVTLESLLLSRPTENRTADSYDPSPDSHSVRSSLSENFSVDLSLIPGLTGLGNIPDSKTSLLHKAGDKLDLSSEALIGCTVEIGCSHEKRFLVHNSQQLILVEPDSRQMGWGIITFIGPLQDLEATCDLTDSRCLHVTINVPGVLSSSISNSSWNPLPGLGGPRSTSSASEVFRNVKSKPLLAARFLFEDHIRCMTARQMLLAGRDCARQAKLRRIATLLDFSPQFLRETFVFSGSLGGRNHGSSGCFTGATDQRVTQFDSGKSRSSPRSNSGASTVSNSGRNPSTFLMGKQYHRSKPQRSDDEIWDGRMPLIALASTVSPASSAASGSQSFSGRGKKTKQGFSCTHVVEPVSHVPVTLVEQQLPTRPLKPLIPTGDSTLVDTRNTLQPSDLNAPSESTTPIENG